MEILEQPAMPFQNVLALVLPYCNKKDIVPVLLIDASCKNILVSEAGLFYAAEKHDKKLFLQLLKQQNTIKLFIFAVMANKLKKKTKNSPEKKTEKPNPKSLKAEKEEKIDWKVLARDERTWKIVGAIFLLISLFLLIAFISYLFTWKEDQDKVFRGSGILIDDNVKVANLLGRFGAFFSHFFIKMVECESLKMAQCVH